MPISQGFARSAGARLSIPRRPFRAVALLACLLVRGAAGEAAGPAVMEQGRSLAGIQAAYARARIRVVGRCTTAVLRCVGLADPAATPAGVCLDRATRACRAGFAALAHLRDRGARRAAAQAARAGGVLFGDDGLAYERLRVFCPRMDPGPGTEDALACQHQALACTADTAVGTLVPRAAELLARAGVVPDEDTGCLAPHLCGNGELDGDEECDDGPANSDTRSDACRTTCVDAFCGDGVVDRDAEEACDDGNRQDGDGCDAGCEREGPSSCGDGVVDAAEDEECDDGNALAGDGCDDACTLEDGGCGDGVVGDDEECDDGAGNSDLLPDGCRTDCTDPICGDGVIDGEQGEECEPPGSLLCDDECASRLPLSASRPSAGLAACQTALLASGSRLFQRTRRLAARCVGLAGRCVLRDGSHQDRCLARASRACHAAARRRDHARDRLLARTAARCTAHLSALLDDREGLGFAPLAPACRFRAPRSPTSADLVACILDRARCLGERAVAQTVPRAAEFLTEALDDPDAAFGCVIDPEDLGSPSGAFAD